MKLKLTRRYVAISASVAVMSLLVLATPAAAGKTQLVSRTAGTEAQSKTIDIVGADIVAINKFVESTFRFKPGSVHVKQGETVVLTNQTTDIHTFTLVDPSLLPTTAAGVFQCGGPGTVCGAVLFTHILPCLSAAPGSDLAAVCAGVMRMTGPPPTSCTVPSPLPGHALVTFCNQVIDATGGSNPSSLANLPLNTPWTTATRTSTCLAPFGFCQGNSVLAFPGETDISFVVNLSPGTHHFMCVFHPWMQGELVVEKSKGD